MPLVGISTRRLRDLVGDDLGRDELVKALEELGCDVEGHALVTVYRCGRCGQVTEALEHEDFNNACAACGSTEITTTGSTEAIRINLLPVRPDMFDAAGLARSLKGYLGIETGLPEYKLGKSGFRVQVKPGLENIRPHIVACVVRGLSMDDETVKTIMKMQENLHWALGRDRRRASIGVYDLDTVKPDFEYRAVRPDGVKFVPLFGMPDGMVAATPKEILENHPKGKAYKRLLDPFPEYPLLCDSQGKVLSMPPIINSDDTRVTPGTRNLFVDVTGPDKNAIAKTLAVIACGLADLKATVETVEIAYPDGSKETTPDLAPGTMALDPKEAVRVLGFDVPAADMVKLLERMRYGIAASGSKAKTQNPKPKISVLVPAYRSDVMHEYDLIEDVGIAYGYRRIKPELVPTMTVSRSQPIEERAETCRGIMTGLGFLETMTLILTSEKEHYEMLRMPVPGRYCLVGNPASIEQTMAREHLLSGLLSTFRVNVTKEMPQFIFETGDCFELAPGAETGVRTRKKLAAGIAGPRAGFADVRQAVDTLARELDLVVRFEAVEHGAFIPGRAAKVMCRRAGRDFQWGILGEVHPEALEAFGIGQPVALFELSLNELV